MSSSSEEKKKITIVSSDGAKFEVEKEVAIQMQIPVPDVSGTILSMVLEYAKKHVELAGNAESIKAFDTEFMKIDQNTLFDLILAANYLNFKSLLDLTCQTLADMMKGKTPEEIRRTFNIKSSCEEKKKVISVSSEHDEAHDRRTSCN